MRATFFNSQFTIQHLQLQETVTTDIAKLAGISKIYEELKDTLNPLDSLQKTLKLMQAKTLNDEIAGSNLISSNEKQANTVMFETVGEQNYTLDSLQLSIVTNIAFQCPYIAGTGVYTARALYAMHDAEQIFDDEYLCNLNGLKKAM